MIGDLVLKATALLAIGWLAAFALRRRAASTRHAAWAGVLAATLMLPLVGAFAPAIELPLLPAAREPAPSVTTIHPSRELVIATNLPPDEGQSRVSLDSRAGSPAPAAAWYQSLTATQIALGAWLAVAMLLALRVTISHIQARALLRACGDPSDRLLGSIGAAAKSLRIRTPPLRVAASGMMPAVIGIARPSVVLPADADAWSDERLELVLRHECAHVRRRDTLMQAISHLATAAYWWHPLAWVAARHIVRERELACDDLVIAGGTPAERYAEHLIDIARSMKASRQPALAALAMARTSQLEGRLMSLLDERPRGSKPSRAMVGGITLAVVAGLAIAPIRLVARAAVAPDIATQAETKPEAAPEPAPAEPAAPPSPEGAPAPTQQNPALNAALLKAMTDEDDDVRAMAASALVRSGVDRAQAIPALMKALDDPSGDVRRNALVGLIRLESAEVMPRLTAALKDESEDVRTIAIAGIRRMNHPDRLALLLQLVGDPSEDVRSLVAVSLAGEDDPRATAALLKLIADPSADVRSAAVLAIGALRREGDAAPVTQALRDVSADVRASAAIALGAIGGDRSVGALTEAMGDADADVRKAALAGIGAINGDVQGVTTIASTIAGTIAGTIQATLFGGSGYVWTGPVTPSSSQNQKARRIVRVTGEVKQPGEYNWEEGLTAGRAIALAGGLTGRGSMRGLTVKRGEKELSATEDFVLQADDIVVVSRRRW